MSDASERETSAAPKRGRKAWRGVRWPYVNRGICSLHKIKVGPTGVCISCHREQLAAAQAGSHEWENTA